MVVSSLLSGWQPAGLWQGMREWLPCNLSHTASLLTRLSCDAQCPSDCSHGSLQGALHGTVCIFGDWGQQKHNSVRGL
jgi:hypothetical protein